MRSGKDALALLCPDWRPATLAFNASADAVAYSNWPCLDMFARGEPARLLGDRLSFGSSGIDRRFRTCVRNALDHGRELSGFVAQSAGEWFSVTVLNPQGFSRDALIRRLGTEIGDNLVVVEVRTHRGTMDGVALESLRHGLGLTVEECEAARLLAAGLSPEDITQQIGGSADQCDRLMSSLVSKAGCRSAHEFLRLLLILCPLRAEGGRHA